MIDENGGKEPDRLTLWEETHKRKDGSYANETTKEKMLEARHLLTTRSADSEEVSKDIIDNVFLEVMGPEHGGRVRGLGIGGPNLKEYYGPMFSRLSENEVYLDELIDQKIAPRDLKNEMEKSELRKELSTANRRIDILSTLLLRLHPELQLDKMFARNNGESSEQHSSHSSYGQSS